MKPKISLRSYTLEMESHAHKYHQILFALSGFINISIEDFKGKVSCGEGLVIKAHKTHSFSASNKSRFLVIDLFELPERLIEYKSIKFPINLALASYLNFVEHQIQYQSNEKVDDLLYPLLAELINQLPMHKVVDRRIERAIAVIHADNDRIHTIKELASVAFIGVTQFKRLFKLATGSTVGQYQTKIKMEKAKSLLLCTDVPITSIAHDLGYSNLSAFTRRFTQHFGLPPSHYQIRQYPD